MDELGGHGNLDLPDEQLVGVMTVDNLARLDEMNLQTLVDQVVEKDIGSEVPAQAFLVESQEVRDVIRSDE
jgi:hypothetical protein